LTKLLAEAKNQGVTILPGKFKYDPKAEKRYPEVCKEYFEKPVETSKYNYKDEEPLFDDFASTNENSSIRDLRKPADFQ
jgi:hypothetical protein